jgi:hypothetical protein
MEQKQECAKGGLGVLSSERQYSPTSARRVIVNLAYVLPLPLTELDWLAQIEPIGDNTVPLNPLNGAVAPGYSQGFRSTIGVELNSCLTLAWCVIRIERKSMLMVRVSLALADNSLTYCTASVHSPMRWSRCLQETMWRHSWTSNG